MNIALYLWLPLYLNDSLGYTSFESGLLSTLFDVGGVAGGPIIGFLSDQDGKTLSWICKASLMSSSAFILMAVFSDQGMLMLGKTLDLEDLAFRNMNLYVITFKPLKVYFI